MAFASISFRAGGSRRLRMRYAKLPARLRSAYLEAARLGAREASKSLKGWATAHRRTGRMKRGIRVRARLTRRGVSVKLHYAFYATFQSGFRQAQERAYSIVRDRVRQAVHRELRRR